MKKSLPIVCFIWIIGSLKLTKVNTAKDGALYVAKKKGRNRVEAFNELS